MSLVQVNPPRNYRIKTCVPKHVWRESLVVFTQSDIMKPQEQCVFLSSHQIINILLILCHSTRFIILPSPLRQIETIENLNQNKFSTLLIEHGRNGSASGAWLYKRKKTQFFGPLFKLDYVLFELKDIYCKYSTSDWKVLSREFLKELWAFEHSINVLLVMA